MTSLSITKKKIESIHTLLVEDVITPEEYIAILNVITIKNDFSDNVVMSEIEHLQRIVADYYGVDAGRIISKERGGEIVRPRQVGIYLAKKFVEASYDDIAKCFGKKDHATIIYAVQKIEEELQNDAKLRHDMDQIVARYNDMDE